MRGRRNFDVARDRERRIDAWDDEGDDDGGDSGEGEVFIIELCDLAIALYGIMFCF